MARETRHDAPANHSPATHAHPTHPAPTGNAEKNPSTWVTGGEPDDSLSKAEASEKIDELRRHNPRVNDEG